MLFKGACYRLGDNIDTDVIIPARYLTTADPQLLAPHLLEDLDGGQDIKAAAGDIIVAGSNFGCGSSREHAPLAIKGAGISCVIALSFGRIFYRNAINIGLPIAECPDAAKIAHGDRLEVDFTTGSVKNLSKDELYPITPFPPFIAAMIEAGGLVAYTKQELEEAL